MVDSQLSDNSITHDPGTGSYTLSHENCPADTVSMCVVRLIATIEEVPAAEMDPLYQSIDPEALDAVCGSFSGSSEPRPEVTFAYAGYQVTVDGGETITATPRE